MLLWSCSLGVVLPEAAAGAPARAMLVVFRRGVSRPSAELGRGVEACPSELELAGVIFEGSPSEEEGLAEG